MALAKRDGKNPHRWADVSAYVLKLANPRYYNDPIVKNPDDDGTSPVPSGRTAAFLVFHGVRFNFFF